MRSPRRLAGEAAALARAVGRASVAHRASPLAVARRARRLRAGHGFEYAEALGEGLLDPRIPEGDLSRHGSRHVTVALQRRLNPEGFAAITGEKAIFYRYAEAVGIPVPALHGVIGRDGRGWAASGRPLAGPDDFRAWVGHDLPPEFVVKPSGGTHGRGVRALVREDGRLRDGSGWSGDPEALRALIAADPRFDLYVVQERLHDHPDVAALSPGSALQTVRIVTLVGADGRPEVLYAVLKLAVGEGDADNFRAGRSGNALVDVALADGGLGMVKTARTDGCGFVRGASAPGTGIRVSGRTLPHWDAALALVRAGALALLPARTLGWDVALTAGGPVVVEANMFWWPRSGPEQGELMERLRRA